MTDVVKAHSPNRIGYDKPCAEKVRFYWARKSKPELKGLDSNGRKLAWSYVYRRCYRHWQTYVGLVLCGIISAVPSYLAFRDFLHAAIGGGIGGLIFGQIVSHLSRPYLAQWKDEVLNWCDYSNVHGTPPMK